MKLRRKRPGVGTQVRLFRKTSVRTFRVLLILLLLTCSTHAAVAQTETTLRVFERLLRRAVLPLLDSLAVPKSDLFVLRVFPESREGSWFVQTRLLRELQEAGYQNLAVTGSAGSQGNQLSLRVDRLHVRLTPLERKGLLARIVELQLSGMLSTADGRTLWAGVLQKNDADTVRAADVPRLSESPYEFTYAAASSRRSKFREFAESTALAAAVGLVTYLFYVYRSR